MPMQCDRGLVKSTLFIVSSHTGLLRRELLCCSTRLSSSTSPKVHIALKVAKDKAPMMDRGGDLHKGAAAEQ